MSRAISAALPRARRPAGDHCARHQFRSLRPRHRAGRPRDPAGRRIARARRQPRRALSGTLQRGSRPEDPDRRHQAAATHRCVLPLAGIDRRADAVREGTRARDRGGGPPWPHADRPLCRRHAGGLHAGRRRGGDRRRPPGLQPHPDRGAGDGPAGGGRGWRRCRRSRAPGVTGWLAPAGDAAALADALDEALSLSAERRAELARAAQEQVRGRYSLAQSNQQLLRLYERLSD